MVVGVEGCGVGVKMCLIIMVVVLIRIVQCISDMDYIHQIINNFVLFSLWPPPLVY